jgi:BirA family biotin operon repressor/biotin-[acetyl-CoA-carboxylase] ligase
MTSEAVRLAAYDGAPSDVLRARIGASRLVALQRCTSTMDIAHTLAVSGAPHGTVVVAEQQDAGRGRTGRTWTSPAGSGVWASVLLRPPLPQQGGVLSLRAGLALAERLDPLATSAVRLKWPNDLYLGEGKLAGILTEARWHGAQLEWIVVGIGVNVRAPSITTPVASLGATATCAGVLALVVQAALFAGAAHGELTEDELRRFALRDMAVGRPIEAPLDGTVLGITGTGGLRVRTADGEAVAVAGSLVFRTL